MQNMNCVQFYTKSCKAQNNKPMKFNGGGGTITCSLAHTSLTIFMWSLFSNFDSKEGRPQVRPKEA